MTQDLGNMSLGADEEDRDDLDFSMGRSQFIGELSVGLGGSGNNRFSSHTDSTHQSSAMQQTVVLQNQADERPIGGSGAAAAQNNFYSTAYDERPINASGAYDLSSVPLDEIDIEDNYSEVEVATMDS